jgi:hypothetical protein
MGKSTISMAIFNTIAAIVVDPVASFWGSQATQLRHLLGLFEDYRHGISFDIWRLFPIGFNSP